MCPEADCFRCRGLVFRKEKEVAMAGKTNQPADVTEIKKGQPVDWEDFLDLCVSAYDL